MTWSRRDPIEPEPTPGRDNVHKRGERVLLREKSPADIADDYRWRSDPELSQLDAGSPIRMSFGAFERYSMDEMNYPATRSKRLSVDTVDGAHIGNVMFYDIDMRKRQAELGIMIGDKDYWGRGYGTETVDLLLDHMFGEYPFERVYLHTLAWNRRARKSFHKSGFKDVKAVRKGPYDFILMEIRREEWETLRAEPASVNGRSASL